MRFFIINMFVFWATGVHAEGFAVRDLSAVTSHIKTFNADGYEHKIEAGRILIHCLECKDEPIIDVQIGQQNDGTEERVRSGQTSFTRLEELCQIKNSSCRLSKLNVPPAVGWITNYTMGAKYGSTAIILRDGDLLTIRSIASDPKTAQTNATKMVNAISKKIIGQ